MASSTLASPTTKTDAQPSVKRRLGFVRFLVSHQRWFALSALIVIVAMVLAALCAPLFFDWDSVTKINLSKSLIAPGSDYWLGTDQMGRDLLGRVLWGARITLTVAVSSVAIAMLVGVSVGAACGYYNGALSSVVMRIMDSMIAFPRTLVAILVITVAGNSILSLTLAIAISSIPIYVRFFAGPVMALRNREFVLASKSIGVSDLRLLLVHILPNIGSLVIIQITVSLAEAILIGSGLSFLGLGPPPPTPEWGSMIAESRPLLTTHPYVLFAPGCALVLTILSFNIVGDALRDFIDPKSRNA
ncbi:MULTISPECIES: ABC transporter permease [unclassified Pseudomonas]|uniref:ABC transporter permease n=1 Tax=unclassified Pseudomonas TaxID=196821 RepID=UPI0012979C98|nr:MULTISPECIES: ABC transporter permease [unclassified Pseudomonas]MQT42781.1 ABC transporter permease subunit [Pseudomonas sp. FSL R10-0765]MQT50580.1 ABC transporter permease subunit [Pseudomonas sp. FSL R10-2398]MQT99447.1 ABC transporter permease subunit [Pseudomonas sp. FSL R10-2245]MQU13180.1 ABC transporter permease subunit [Pseudomonas sp. FSL R10-2189]MQU37725.1 ABC transporter permease subunit [Pseudomonas sp. FSL R10-2172]